MVSFGGGGARRARSGRGWGRGVSGSFWEGAGRVRFWEGRGAASSFWAVRVRLVLGGAGGSMAQAPQLHGLRVGPRKSHRR